MTVSKFSDIIVANMQFSDLAGSSRVSSQNISFITYNGLNLMMQTPTLITETYGIPRPSDFYKDDKSRSFYKLPFCHDRKQFEDIKYHQIEAFYHKLREIDALCSSVEFRKRMFGDKFDKYRYSPLVREAQTNEEEEQIVSASYKPPYTKLKIQLEYHTNKPLIHIRDGITKSTKTVSCIDDCCQHIRYLSKVRFIIHFNKFYQMKTSTGNGQKQYGITLTIKHAEFFPKEHLEIPSMISFLSDTDGEEDKSKLKISRVS
jgi:hypothetical protein